MIRQNAGWYQTLDEQGLWECSVLPDAFLEDFLVPFHGHRTGSNDGLETEPVSVTPFSAVGLSHRKLLDMKAQEIEAYLFFTSSQCVRQMRLAWFQG